MTNTNDNPMTPRPQSDERTTTDPDRMRRVYRELRKNGIRDELAALDWLIVHNELSRMGWTLTADESDWLPPSDFEDWELGGYETR